MSSYENDLRILDAELQVVAQAFAELSDEQWALPTLLRPLEENLPHWTLFELAGHFDISIGLTRMLIADQENTTGQVGRDRTSFFIFPRSEVAPVVYDYAYTIIAQKVATVKGVSESRIFGQKPYAVHVQVNPAAA